MISSGFAFCAGCRQRRAVDDLLLVLPVDRAPFGVCRPYRSQTRDGVSCFRRLTRSAEREPIRLLAEYLAEHRPSHTDTGGGIDAIA